MDAHWSGGDEHWIAYAEVASGGGQPTVSRATAKKS
jgi:hypothetical protein